MTLEAAVYPCYPAARTEAQSLVLTLSQCIYSLAFRKRNLEIFIPSFMADVSRRYIESQLFDKRRGVCLLDTVIVFNF